MAPPWWHLSSSGQLALEARAEPRIAGDEPGEDEPADPDSSGRVGDDGTRTAGSTPA